MSETVELATVFQRGRDGLWIGFCPAVRGAYAQGESLDDCRRRLADAVETVLGYAPSDDLDDLVDSEAEEAIAEIMGVELPERQPGERLISQADIARLAGVSRQRVSQWVHQRDDFPPSRSGAGRPAWDMDDVLRWIAAADRSPGPARRSVSAWRQEDHRTLAFVCRLHVAGAAETEQVADDLQGALSRAVKSVGGEWGEIRPLGWIRHS